MTRGIILLAWHLDFF